MIRTNTIFRLKTLIPSTPQSPPTPLKSLLLQSSPVSGTAKGKGKIKEGQTLKRSTIPKKKPTSTPSSPKGSRMNQAMDRLSKMIDSCLDAPTPIRYLTEKERKREAEREKLGLISKERQREIDMAKAKAKLDKKQEKAEKKGFVCSMGTPGLDPVTLGLIDEKDLPKFELTVEDGRRLAKEYSRVLMRKLRARQAAETTLLRLKKEAIEALPEHLKQAALVPDLTPFPVNRFMATLTPPIEGYIDKIKEAAMKNVGKEKLR